MFIVFVVVVVIDGLFLLWDFMRVFLGIRDFFIIRYLICFVRDLLQLNDLHQSFSFFFIHAIDESASQCSNVIFFNLHFPRLFLCFNHSSCLLLIIIHHIIPTTNDLDHLDDHHLKPAYVIPLLHVILNILHLAITLHLQYLVAHSS